MVEDWFLLCQRQPEFIPAAASTFDWLSNDREYNKEDMVSFVDRAKQSASTNNELHNQNVVTIDVNTLNETQMKAFKIVKNYFERENLFQKPLRLIVSGTAGTGKSYLIKCIKQLMGQHCRLLAPTGDAAHNIDGETLHRCFRLGININDNTPELTGNVLMEAQNENCVVDLFIIDGMSMVGKRLFGMIDQRMRQIFPDGAAEPLGGKGVVLVGGFGQLNPVCDIPLYSSDGHSKLSDIGGAVYSQFDQAVVLKAVIRQSTDKHLRDLLTHVRDDQVTLAHHNLLQLEYMVQLPPGMKLNSLTHYA